MLYYLIRRVIQMAVVVFLSSLAIYILLNIAPGGPLSGLRLNSDRRSRVSDVGIARLEAYLGLDKPLALRYIVWLFGDDWLGADWVYGGITHYKRARLGKDGEPLFELNLETGEHEQAFETARFWTDPGVPLLKPGYDLWVWGEEIELDVFAAHKIQVKPPSTAVAPDDVIQVGHVISVTGTEVEIEDLNDKNYIVRTDSETSFIFPEGEGKPRPEDGFWLDIGWLTGAEGRLGEFAGFHGESRGILRLDFGFSWRVSPHQPVAQIIASRFGNTIALMATATIVSMVIAIPIGIYSAVNQYSKMDYVVTSFAFFGSAMPVFWFGLMMVLVFSLFFKQWGLPFLPTGGTSLSRAAQPGSLLALLGAEPGSITDRLVHLLIPTVVLSLQSMATWSRFMRGSMLEVMRMEYIRMARAKGQIERIVIFRHAARNALIPLISIIVFQLPSVFGGSILVETIFSYPGMGRLLYQALSLSDWPIVMVIMFISAVLVVVATLVRDLLYTVVDPRIKLS